MSRKRHKPEEIVTKLRQVEVLTAQGRTVAEAIRSIGVTEVTFYRWRQEYGGLKGDQVKRLKELRPRTRGFAGPLPSNKVGVKSRRRLLAAGLVEFHRVGYEAAGVDAITRSAGIPKGSFYNHFGSKEMFGAAVIDAFFEGLLTELRSAVEDKTRPPLERLRSHSDQRNAELSAADHRGGCLLGNMGLEIADRSEILRERVAAHLRTWSQMLAGFVRQAQKRGDIDSQRNADALADFVLNSWQGAVLRAKASRSPEPLRIAETMIFDVILAPATRASSRAARVE